MGAKALPRKTYPYSLPEHRFVGRTHGVEEEEKRPAKNGS